MTDVSKIDWRQSAGFIGVGAVFALLFSAFVATADWLLDLSISYTCRGATQGAVVRMFPTDAEIARYRAWCEPVWSKERKKHEAN